MATIGRRMRAAVRLLDTIPSNRKHFGSFTINALWRHYTPFDKRQFENQHDTNASWANGGYDRDFKEGENNMNEEWFGICEKGLTKSNGLYDLKPRLAYYVLKEVHDIDIYNSTMNLNNLEKEMNKINLKTIKSKN